MAHVWYLHKKTRILILTDTQTLLPRKIHGLMTSLLSIEPALLVLPVLSVYEFHKESCYRREFTQRCLPICLMKFSSIQLLVRLEFKIWRYPGIFSLAMFDSRLWEFFWVSCLVCFGIPFRLWIVVVGSYGRLRIRRPLKRPCLCRFLEVLVFIFPGNVVRCSFTKWFVEFVVLTLSVVNCRSN